MKEILFIELQPSLAHFTCVGRCLSTGLLVILWDCKTGQIHRSGATMRCNRMAINMSSVTTVKKVFVLLALTGGILVILNFIDLSTKKSPKRKPLMVDKPDNKVHSIQESKGKRLTAAHDPIPAEQCPKQHAKDCSRRVLDTNEFHKWIAIWVPAKPKVDVSHLTKIPGWKTVVVGDGACPKGCRYPGCVFLDPASQAALGSSLASLLARDDPAKKNLAYLYAIKQGAYFIYDTDVTSRPLYNLSDFFYGATSGVVYIGKGMFNYYKHYGEHWFRPPGFVSLDKKENDPAGYVVSDIQQPDVQYGLVKAKDKSRPRFHSGVPTVFVGSQSFAPFDSSNTMFNARSFWGLFTFPGQDSEIMRSFVLQTLLKYIHGYVGFLRPNVEQDPVHVTKRSKRDISTRLVSYLYKWQCKDNTNIGTCVSQLSSDLLAEKFINDKESKMTRAWLSDLKQIGYKIADIFVRKPLKLARKINKLPSGAPNSTTVVLSQSPGVFHFKNPESRTYKHVTRMCETFKYPPRESYQFDDILLIVMFNTAFLYKSMMYVESIYRRNFPNILLCGPDIESFRLAVASLPVNSTVTYVTGMERGWTYSQECTIYAMKMNFNVKGYLQIGDDTLINPWSLKTLPRNQIWFNNYVLRLNRTLYNETGWSWWSQPIGKKALDISFSHIEKTAKKPEDSKEKRFYNFYMKNVRTFNRVFHQTCDFFYIPNSLKDDFIYFTKLFFKSSLANELALPTMILGLADGRNITRVVGRMLWGERRYEPEIHFHANEHYLHAFKGMAQMKKPNCKKFMCNTFLPTLVQRMDLNWKGTDFKGKRMDVKGEKIELKGKRVDVKSAKMEYKGKGMNNKGAKKDLKGGKVNLKREKMDYKGKRMDRKSGHKKS